ncbi:MAG: hypothetical protein M9899_02815 [Bdellovibrionaceae bacterium]|nr:hypothetical protein [Pseudobdellovibrionaceae bacterium]
MMKRIQWNFKKQHQRLLGVVCLLTLFFSSWSAWSNTTPKYRIILPPVTNQDNILLAFKYQPYAEKQGDKAGGLSENATFLSHNQSVEIKNLSPAILENKYADVKYYTPGVAIVINGVTYYTDARYIYEEGSSQSLYEKNFDAYRRLYLSTPLQGIPPSSEAAPYHVNRDLYRAAVSSPAGYLGDGYKPAPGSEAQGVVEEGQGAGATPADTTGQTVTPPATSDIGNDISVDLAGDSSAGEQPETPDGATSPIPIPKPRPALAEYSTEALEGITLAVKDNLQAEILSNNGASQSGNYDLIKGARVKIIPDGKTEVINGETWREVEFLHGFDRRRLMVPQSKLLTTSGETLTASTPVKVNGTAQGPAAEEIKEDEAKPEDAAAVVAAPEAAPAEVPVSTCTNPEYLSYLTNQNPNCKLLPIERLVRSGLNQGDAVLAMSKNDKKCYKLSVGQVTYSDDDALNKVIEKVTKDRKDSYEAISRFLQNGHLGFVSQSAPAVNRYTISCHDRTKVCSLGFGFESAQRMPHVKTITMPVRLESNVATDLQIQIYGPNADGYYVVRHMNGNTPGRVLLVEGRQKIEEAIRMMDKHTSDFANIQLSEADKAKANRNKMVLYAQLGDATGDKQTKTFEVNPKKPFEQIASLNKDFSFYNISCKREDYNPLMSVPASDRPSDSSGVE